MSACLSVWLPACLSVCLFVCAPLYLLDGQLIPFQVIYSAENIRLDILEMAKFDDGFVRTHGAPSFDAKCDVTNASSSYDVIGASSSISFVAEGSFVVLPPSSFHSPGGSSSSVLLRFITNEPNGLLLYGLGTSTASDFFGLEIIEGEKDFSKFHSID